MTLRTPWAAVTVALLAGAAAAQQSSSITGTKHNLSVSGPGPFRAASESRICIFCHAPHRSRLQAPLWNREDSTTTYLTYRSSTFEGSVSQPNGSTKLCLSCHDGTIALGKVVSLNREIEMATGRRFLDTGHGFLGTSLRDDHPVSFDYASSRGGSGVDYRPPAAITAPVKLEAGRVQCTSCHDAHDNSHGDFLRRTDRQSLVCTSCHDMRDWGTASHKVSTATWNGLGPDPWPGGKYETVADNACASCHLSHGAGEPQRLLRFAVEEDNCLRCHDGNVARLDVGRDVDKPFAHSPVMTVGVHDAAEDPLAMPRHAECQDCHDPHAARRGAAPAPGVAGPLAGASGMNTAGSLVDRISFGYEVCYKCHADRHGSTPAVSRVLQQMNVRLEFDPANPSFHPVEAPGRNADVPSLLPPWTTASLVACTDCHDSDSSPGFGGMAARGPHGSIYAPLLGANYDTRDGIPESPNAYALCYKCHSRASILGNESFAKHEKHIVGEKAACSVCHDPHGISASQGSSSGNTHLINFDSRVVRPALGKGGLRFEDRGVRAGSCTLLCHRKNHVDQRYGR